MVHINTVSAWLRTFTVNSALSQSCGFWEALLAKIWWLGAHKHFIGPCRCSSWLTAWIASFQVWLLGISSLSWILYQCSVFCRWINLLPSLNLAALPTYSKRETWYSCLKMAILSMALRWRTAALWQQLIYASKCSYSLCSLTAKAVGAHHSARGCWYW